MNKHCIEFDNRKNRKKIVFCGASQRAYVGYAKHLVAKYGDQYEIAGIFDIDIGRMKGFCELLGKEVAKYTDYDRMLSEIKPDEVFISTIDATHADYLVKAIRQGINCICEKPLCIDAEQCRAILSELKSHPAVSAYTAHNLRYIPEAIKIKELLDAGAIGDLRSITFNELLDRRHGKSYFRRWNRRKENSGGLLIHKSSHHFDLFNWLVGSRAQEVIAQGQLIAYGAAASPFRGENCRTCEHAGKCPDYVDYHDTDVRNQLFYKHMVPDGYTPDLCIFSPEINIEDQATVGITYANGIGVSYSLNAHSSIAGHNMYIEGTTGTIEYISRSDSSGYGDLTKFPNTLKLWRMDGESETIPVSRVDGGHGGADTLICRDFFGGSRCTNKHLASLMDGIQAVLIGTAANISIETGKEVDVQALLRL